ncbi:HEAT domain containing protein [Rubidibacter lacunae KORDI 51-2]|uniref:HEAT domain containing protein n=1 Tax=Rubidibacter lacunae KORDI 51-2 TaxID=582515 RepID=U5DBP8_9CHRO|nr:HEAT repeat domain-containing protein [Rubidibacter lacunae]ERN41958.1 HEAT domain containing protein [Rubidibacter lacunae KORDI 51-2]
MDKRFSNLFGLTEEEAIALLETPQEQVGEEDSRYIAAAHLVNFPTERAIDALIKTVKSTDTTLDNRIVRRKAIESLGRLRAVRALPAIRACLGENDVYTVENAVWAIGEIGTEDADILEEIACLLEKPGQLHRAIVHVLAKLNYNPALNRIRQFVDADDEPTASAAISAVCRFTGDFSTIGGVVAFLQHPNVNARRLSIQDLIDAGYYAAIPDIARCPVSVVFRLRGIRFLAEAGILQADLTFHDVQPALDLAIRDRPDELTLVHEYDFPPSVEFAIGELYQTDFGRCYLAGKTLLEAHADVAGEALLATYTNGASNDYGAHYHVIKLLGWLRYTPGYELALASLHNPMPQFRKSRAAAAIALGEFGDRRAIPELKRCLDTNIWDLKYAVLMSLDRLGETQACIAAIDDEDWLVREKARAITRSQPRLD